MRYQLLRTSPYLSGQARWDIPLYYHYNDGEHVIDTPELHIVPLNENLVFNEDNDRDTLHYSHLENLKYLYDRMGDDFYSAAGEWGGDKWLYNGGNNLDPYSHIFIMGTRRMRFERYQKQFSFLCPLWISEETDPSRFSFEVSVKVVGEERDHIARRVFSLSPELCSYMSEFLNKSARYIDPDPSEYPDPSLAPYMGVDDSLLSIKFDPDEAFITGIQVDAAKYTTKDISYIIDALLRREVPMMEFDNNLLFNFKENHIIAQQLINLNFVFNMDDISFFLKDALLGKNITISIRVKYDDSYLPIKDLYTNYTNIPVYRIDTGELSNEYNVCDYLGDHRIIDYVQANKFTQPIFHWSMVENPEFIYNFYDGFAPVFLGGESEPHKIRGRYYDQADISQDVSTVYNNASHWCRYNNYTGLSTTTVENRILYAHLHPETLYSKLYFNEDSMIAYLNNNRYNMMDVRWDANGSTEDVDGVTYIGAGDVTIYMANIIVDQDVMDNLFGQGVHQGMKYEYHQDDKTFLIDFYSTDESTATLKNISDYLPNYTNPMNSYIKIFRMLEALANAWIPPYRIEFSRSIITEVVPPVGDEHPTELNMYQDNLANNFVLRYTGRLCPMFIDPTHEYYRNINFPYRQWGDINTKDVQYYNRMLKTGFNPNYPSIGYYTYLAEQDNTLRPDFYNGWEGDVTWKNDGCINVLPERYITTFLEDNPIPYTEQAEELKFWELLYNHIATLMDKTELSLWFKHWLKEIYQIEYNFDYPNDHSVNEILYTVTFRLR